MSVFGTNIKEIEDQWHEEGMSPKLGSVKNDLMSQAWEDFNNPVKHFKREGLYKELRDVVHDNKVTGTFYRYADNCEHLLSGDLIDFRSELTRWYTELIPNNSEEHYLKLECENVPGLGLEDEIILGECQLHVLNNDGQEILVAIASMATK